MDPSLPPAIPTTRKRRWKIGIGLILSCAALLLWLLWPVPLNDVEKKLVGTWTPGHFRGMMFIQLNADRTVNYYGPTRTPESGSWRATSGSLYWDAGFKDIIETRIRKILHSQHDTNNLELLSVDDESFRVYMPVNGCTFEYFRVPVSAVASASGTASPE